MEVVWSINFPSPPLMKKGRPEISLERPIHGLADVKRNDHQKCEECHREPKRSGGGLNSELKFIKT